VWEPTLPEGSVRAPFYAQTASALNRIPGGQWIADHLLTIVENDTDEVLRACGLAPQDVDFVSFDHLHVQDVRMVLGTTAPIPGERTPSTTRWCSRRLWPTRAVTIRAGAR
jgi:hypothetical protein